MGYTRITGERGGLRRRVAATSSRSTPTPRSHQRHRDQHVGRDQDARRCSPSSSSPCGTPNDDQTNYQRNLSIGEVEVEVDGPHGSAIYHRTEYRERRNHYAVYAVNATDRSGFDTDRDTFVGAYNGLGEAAVPRVGRLGGLGRLRLVPDRLASA